MVLADDNFATIVAAVGEGRRIYDNIRRFVRYVLTTNSGEIWVMFLATMLALPVPMLPSLFDTEPLAPVQLAAVLAASTVAFIAVEIEKWVRRRTSP